jgi:hypothetical protein
MTRWFRQLFALCRKNVIVLANHYLVSRLALILPEANCIAAQSLPMRYTPRLVCFIYGKCASCAFHGDQHTHFPVGARNLHRKQQGAQIIIPRWTWLTS